MIRLSLLFFILGYSTVIVVAFRRYSDNNNLLFPTLIDQFKYDFDRANSFMVSNVEQNLANLDPAYSIEMDKARNDVERDSKFKKAHFNMPPETKKRRQYNSNSFDLLSGGGLG